MGGTIYRAVMEKAADLPFVRDYMEGKTDIAVFRYEISKNGEQLASLGICEWWACLLARFPNDLWRGAGKLADALSAAGIADPAPRLKEDFLKFEALVERRFAHLPDRYMSIFPEETRIAYALSRALKPKSVFVAGSYYGYLAVWLIPGLAPDATMICSDVDAEVCSLAVRNFEALGERGRAAVVCEDAEKLLRSGTGPIDLIVLDAYGGHGHPDPRYHGKAIYGPLLQAALPRLHAKSMLLVHNAERGAEDLSEFFNIVGSARFSLHLDTTDNMAVYQL